MKKKVVICLCLAMLAVTACGKKVECDLCGEEKRCEEAKVFGEEINICNDCKDVLQNGFD